MLLDLTKFQFAASVPPAVSRAYAHARLLFDADEVDKAVDQLAVRLSVEYQNADPVFITLLPDGYVLGGMLMRRLVFPLKHRAAHVDASHHPILENARDLAGRPVIVIAGQLSTAQSQALSRWATQQAILRLSRVVMAGAEMIEHGGAGKEATLVALTTNATPWIGCGFEVGGYGANLPGLYQLSTEVG